jgi:hypothetical protein
MWVLYVSILAQETLFFQVVSRDYLPVMLFGTTGCFICFVSTFLGFETPIWLLKANRIDEGRKALEFIAKVNKKPEL